MVAIDNLGATANSGVRGAWRRYKIDFRNDDLFKKVVRCGGFPS
jgi:hypothetical protein